MKKRPKKFFKKIFIIILLVLAGYGIVKLYDYVIQDASQKIKKNVTRGILSTLNPLTWPGKIFGSKK